MIIDFHTHCFPDKVAEKAIPALSKAGGIKPKLNGTASDLHRSMDRAGIDMSVIMPIATRPEQTKNINDWSAGHISERLKFFGTIHPVFEDWEAELVRIKEMGLKGVKFHPEYQNFDVDSPAMFPIYKFASELGLILLFHAGRDFAFEPPCHCPPARLSAVAEKLPDTRIVAAHMGGYLLWEDVENHLAGTNIYLDTSFSVGKMGSEQFFRIIDRHGTDRVLFATDSPWTDQKLELEAIKGIGLDTEAEQKILGENAMRLLDIGEGS